MKAHTILGIRYLSITPRPTDPGVFVVEIFHALVASYLIATLGATALAKLKNRRIVSVSIQREGVIPAGVAPVFTGMLVTVEFLLATLLTFGAAPAATDFAAAALFVSFAGYRVMVAIKTKSLTCSCAGTIQTDPASFPSVGGAGFACLILAALACTLAFVGRPAGYPVNFLAIAAWISPFVSLAAGARPRHRGPNTGEVFPKEFLPLWTAEVNAKR
jgi:hypothetical protein